MGILIDKETKDALIRAVNILEWFKSQSENGYISIEIKGNELRVEVKRK